MGAIALLTPPGGVEAQSQSASRAFQRTWAAPGSELRVTITASNYGAFGQVVETLPEGFTFVRSRRCLDTQIEQEAQVVRFNLFGGLQLHVLCYGFNHGRAVHLHRRRQERRPGRTQGHRPHAVPRRSAANPSADVDRHAGADGYAYAGANGNANP